MDRKELDRILDRIRDIKVAVVGDFALDRYYICDTRLNEPSLETGLTAYQVVKHTMAPGACGSVVNNLCAMGTGAVYAVGFFGNDGAGTDLKRGLDERKVQDDYFFMTDQMVTPQYIKTVMMDGKTRKESNRFDIKNFSRTPEALETKILDSLPHVFEQMDAVVVLDQMTEANCGVITDKVREQLIRLAKNYRHKVIYADSRARIGLFDGFVIKCNNYEAVKAFEPDLQGEPSFEQIKNAGLTFVRKNKRPAFVTAGKEGLVVFGEDRITHIPSVDIPPPLDICGAGDSVTAAVVNALAVRATPEDAGVLGNVVAAITITQIGTTGTASPRQIREEYERHFADISLQKLTEA